MAPPASLGQPDATSGATRAGPGGTARGRLRRDVLGSWPACPVQRVVLQAANILARVLPVHGQGEQDRDVEADDDEVVAVAVGTFTTFG